MSFVVTAVVVTVAAGAMQARGAYVQAKGMEQQAKQAELLAANRAQIERNNAIGRAQDEQFQSGVADFNKQEVLIETNKQAELADKQIAASLASQEAKAGRAGLAGASFEDLLNAESLTLEKEEAKILYSGGQEGYQQSKSAELGDLRGKRAIEMGRYSSDLAIAEGRYQSSSLKNQASAARIGGAAAFVGSLGSAAGQKASYDK
jgi:hypothetical protein|tara:strand:- start:700 stop:1314 length:615 start_codon:yes stop_codon:yes gene_type:complete